VETTLDTGDRSVYLAAVVAAKPPDPRPLLTTHRMIALASPERRNELSAQIARDMLIDARAIEEWRQKRSV
jgi:hypothetical protein